MTELSIEQLLQQTRVTLDEEITKFNDGEISSFVPAEEKIQSLCDVLITLPQDQILAYEPQMKELQEKLLLLVRNMSAMREKIKKEVTSLNTQKEAQALYKKNEVLVDDTVSETE